MSKKYNNADTTLAGDLQASGDTFVVKAWEGALFPPTADAPYKVTHEHRDGEYVIKREVLTVDSRTGDSFHISARASEYCVQDDSASTKTRTNNALSFVSGDRVFLGTTEEDWNELQEEVYTNIPQDIVDAKNDLKKEIQKGDVIYGASSTGNDGYAITLDPAPTALADIKGSIYFLADVANEGSASLNINGLGAKTIKKKNDQDLGDGDIEANQKVEVVYDSVNDVFEMVSQVASVISVDVGVTGSDLVAGEDISRGAPLRMGTDLYFKDYEHTKGASNYNYTSSKIGYSTTYFAGGQSFIADASRDLSSIEVQIGNVGTPTGNLIAKLYANDGTTLLETSATTFASGDVTGGWLKFEFTYTLVSGTEYRVKVETDQAVSTSNHYQWYQYGSSNDGDEGTGYYVNSSNSWSTGNYAAEKNMIVNTIISEDDTKVFECDHTNQYKLGIIGFAESGVLEGETVKVNTAGLNLHQDDLVEGKEYYLNERYTNISDNANIEQTDGTQTSTYGRVWRIDGNVEKVGQTVLLGSNDKVVRYVDVDIMKAGTPGASIKCKIYQSDKSTLIADATNEFTASDITTSLATYRFNFWDVSIPAWEEIFIELSTSSLNNSNYYTVAYSVDNNPYADGKLWYYTTSWTVHNTRDMKFVLKTGTGDKSLISDEPGDNEVKVGRAITDGAILIYPGGQSSSKDVAFVTATVATGSASFTTTYSHDLGKIPEKIECFASTSTRDSHGWYENEKYGSASYEGGARTDSIGTMYYSTSDYFLMKIQNVTESTFDVYYQEVGSCSTTNGRAIFKLT